MKQNKTLTYILFGVPLLVAAYFGYKAIKKAQEAKLGESTDDTKTEPKTESDGTTSGGGSTSGGGTPSSSDVLPFKKGKTSAYNVFIQTKLGVSPTSTSFGNKTDAAVKAFQIKNKLTVDGIVGSKTWKALFGVDFPSTEISAAITPVTNELGVGEVLPSNQNAIRINTANQALKGAIKDGNYYSTIVKLNNLSDINFKENGKTIVIKANEGYAKSFHTKPKVYIDSIGMIHIEGKAAYNYNDVKIVISPYNISFV